MKHILTFSLCLLFMSCSDYDTQNDMIEKCKNLKGLNEFVLNETTINDIYKNFKENKIIENTWSFAPNIPSVKGDICINAHWRPIIIKDYQGYYNNKIRLEFYKDTLVQINYHNFFENNRIYDSIKKQFGKGIQVPQSYIDSIIGTCSYGIFKFEGNRLYQNKDIYLIVDKDEKEFIILHKAKLDKLLCAIIEANAEYKEPATSNIEDASKTNSISNKRTYGEYTNHIDGSHSNKYKGSLEQLRDLQMIDEYMRNNPDF